MIEPISLFSVFSAKTSAFNKPNPSVTTFLLFNKSSDLKSSISSFLILYVLEWAPEKNKKNERNAVMMIFKNLKFILSK